MTTQHHLAEITSKLDSILSELAELRGRVKTLEMKQVVVIEREKAVPAPYTPNPYAPVPTPLPLQPYVLPMTPPKWPDVWCSSDGKVEVSKNSLRIKLDDTPGLLQQFDVSTSPPAVPYPLI